MTDQLPFETSQDAQAWRLSRREAAVNERERQVALREKELASRDIARQRAESALESEQQRAVELEGQLQAAEARIAELENTLLERTASLKRTQDEAAGLRASLGRMTQRVEKRRPAPAAVTPSSRAARADDPVLTTGTASSAAQRWIPIDAGTPRRRRA